MAELKREYVVPLRRKTKTAPKWRRSKKSVSVLKDFIRKHMKTEDVIICSELNEHIWGRGAKNPPGKVSVIALRKSIGGEDKTIVNLLEAGIDKQAEMYVQPQDAKVAPAKTTETDVKDAEVKEVETKEKSKETPKVETKEEPTAQTSKKVEKKEEKKNE